MEKTYGLTKVPSPITLSTNTNNVRYYYFAKKVPHATRHKKQTCESFIQALAAAQPYICFLYFIRKNSTVICIITDPPFKKLKYNQLQFPKKTYIFPEVQKWQL